MSTNENRSSSRSDAGRRPPDPKFLETAAHGPLGDTDPARPAAATTMAAATWVGRSLGKYQVTAVLGRGGMGVVFRAHDPLIDRDVAIKLLSEELADDETALARFLAEAKAAGKLNHPNVVAVYDIGQEGRAYFLVMELVTGGSVGDKIERNPLSVLESTRVLMDACKGLATAHQVGLIHRDIKPANLMKAADGTVKVTDFGLAKTTAAKAREVTQAGLVVGTPYFMSPEQCEARPVDARSDIYSLGATYYSLLTGRNPYEDSASVIQVMFGHCQGEIPDPRKSNPAIPMACSAIVARAMAKSPADRYQTAAEMLADLEAVSATLSGATRIELPSQSGTRAALAAALATAAATTQTATLPAIAPPIPAAAKSNRAVLIGGALALAAVVLAAIVFGPWRNRNDGGSTTGSGSGSGSGVAANSVPGNGDHGPADQPGAKPPMTTPAGPGIIVRGVTPTEIVLGMSGPFNGPASELGRQVQVGLQAYFASVNDRGGIAGRKIRLVALDDGYEPARALANMQKLYDQDQVFAVIGNVGTPTAEKTVPFALDKKMLFFGGFTGAKLLRKDPPDRYVFNLRASYEEETAAILEYLVKIKKIKPEQVAVFAQQDGYGDSGYNGVVKMVRKLGGDPDKLLRVGYVRNTADVADAAAAIIKDSDRKAIIMVPLYHPAARFIQIVKDAGRDPIFASVSFVGSMQLADELMQFGPDYCEGVIVTQVVPFPQSQATAVAKYREALAKYAPSERPGFISLEGYLDAMLFCQALEKTGSNLTTDSLIDALESIKDLDLGIGAPITFGPSDHQGSQKIWGTVIDKTGQFQVLDME